MTIIKKLSSISSSVGSIPKNGYNAYQKYKYLKIDDIYEFFNKQLSKEGIVFSTQVDSYQVDGKLIYGLVTGIFSDGESEIRCQVGSAANAGDKMMRNLMQNAVKQIFLQVFCISSGDPDPDGENSETKKASPTPQKTNSYLRIPNKKWNVESFMNNVMDLDKKTGICKIPSKETGELKEYKLSKEQLEESINFLAKTK